MTDHDVVVVGAGAMGSAAAWWLARRGRSVLVLEQFEQGHVLGSSHGASRIFRLAYPHVDYVRMAQAALPLWRELEDDAGATLLEITGAIDHGPDAALRPTVDALRACGADHELLRPEEARALWPGMRFDEPVLLHPDGGRVRSDTTIRALQDRAAQHGADVRFREPVDAISVRGDEVRVRTPVDEHRAATAIVACGSWAAPVLDGLVPLPPLTVTQEQPFHFRTRSAYDGVEWPSFIHHRSPLVYGLETPGEGVKVAEHRTGAVVDPDRRSFTVDPVGRGRVERYVAEWFPGLLPDPVTETTCLYTTTPTEDFVIDRRGPVVVAAGFSGHGFKFTPLVGRLLADLADGRPGPGGRFSLRS